MKYICTKSIIFEPLSIDSAIDKAVGKFRNYQVEGDADNV